MFTLLIIRQIGKWDGDFPDQDSLLTAIVLSLVAIPLFYWNSNSRNERKRKKAGKLLTKVKRVLLKLFLKKEKKGIGWVLAVLGTAAMVALILLLGWLAGLAIILGIFLMIIFVIRPPD